MKEFKILVPNRKRDVVNELLQSYNIESWTIPAEESILFIINVEDSQSNVLVHELGIRGIGSIFGEVTITIINTIFKSAQTKDKLPTSRGTNIEEILSVLEDSAVINSNYISLVVLSAILAAFGLVEGNVVIIIGSMIVAPLMGPIALASLGAITPGRAFLEKGLMAEVIGISITVFVGYVVGELMDIGGKTPINFEMSSRATLNIVVIVFALVSGIAAGLIIVQGSNFSIVGVAIAASLAPPAANIGLYLAAFDLFHANQAVLLLSINVLAINLACSLIFLLFGLAESAGGSKRQKEQASKANLIIIGIVGILLTIVSIIALLTG